MEEFIVGWFDRLFTESYTSQISARGFADLLGAALAHRTEILVFMEASYMLIIPQDHRELTRIISTEFDDVPTGIVHGQGGGHAFIRVAYLQDIVRGHQGVISDYPTLVSIFRKRGYRVKRVNSIAFTER